MMAQKMILKTGQLQVQRWALQSPQVELLEIPGNMTETRLEVVAEDHWQVLYILRGELKQFLLDDKGYQVHYRIEKNACSLRYLPRGYCLKDCSNEQGYRILSIKCKNPEMLGQGRLRRKVEEARRLNVAVTLDIQVNRQIQQLVEGIDNLQGEGKSMLLVLSRAIALLQQVTLVREPGQVTTQEREKQAIDAACRILETRLDSPPSLDELAAEVGMSATRFKSSFSRICGMPPFAWLRDLRLQKARCLLQQESMRVTEVALEVGYTNFSHFAKIFEARFGVIPSRVRQEVIFRLAALVFGLKSMATL